MIAITKRRFFTLGPAVRGAREKITFLKWVRGVFPGKNRSRKRGLIGANYGGDFSGALAAIPGLVALAMCRQGPLASPAVQAAGARPRDRAKAAHPSASRSRTALFSTQ